MQLLGSVGTKAQHWGHGGHGGGDTLVRGALPGDVSGPRLGSGDVLQVGDVHEGAVEVVELQDAGQQEKTRDEGAGEELGDAELLQTQVTQPGQGGDNPVSSGTPPCTRPAAPRKGLGGSTQPSRASVSPSFGRAPVPGCRQRAGRTHCWLVRPVRFLQYMGKSSNWKV